MKRIDVSLSQFVMAGEPVGIMGSANGQKNGRENGENSDGNDSPAMVEKARLAGNHAPTLYIEFRKKGRPINPDPWWNKAVRVAGKGKV
jgi:septal ring factor EnvC (AmiA/AmiB activator)